jgi:hypothetical protein
MAAPDQAGPETEAEADPQPRVVELVNSLTSAFESGLASYQEWKDKQRRHNHYQQKPETSESARVVRCALSVSLDTSSHRIKAAYQVGFALIGSDFATGDGQTACPPFN